MRSRYLLVPLAMALASGVAAIPLTRAQAAVELSITTAPPPLPDYEQPPLPGPGYVWTPGYWAYGPDGYYWVPGTWVEPPGVGMLWTPGYWAWDNDNYVWNEGYWGPTVGFYGGVDYGYGYNGDGFYGGRWDHGYFAYNTDVWNVRGVHVPHSYRQSVPHMRRGDRVSFHGGRGGLNARPTAAQERAAHERHLRATVLQTRQLNTARQDPRLRASTNHGRPPIAATGRAGDFRAHTMSATGAGNSVPNAARPNERGAIAPNQAHPRAQGATPNAARPDMRGAISPRTGRPQGQGLAPNAVHPEARGAAPNAAHRDVRGVTPNAAQPPGRAGARPPAAFRPEARHPTATQAPSRAAPHPMARPAAAPHPMPHAAPRPTAHPAPHPAAGRAGPAKQDQKP